VLIIFTNNTPQKIQAMAIPAPIPSDGQWTVRLDVPCDFFESGSMVAIKNHADLGLYYTSKKSKLPIISNL
jgi:hypothetical protein